MFIRVRWVDRERRLQVQEAELTIELELSLPLLLWMRSRRNSEDEEPAVEEILDVLDALPDAVATFDGDGRLFHLNAAGRRLLGRDEPDFDPEPLILSHIVPEASAERLLREALPEAARAGRWEGRGELLTRNGGRIPVMLHLVAHPPEDGKSRAFTLVARLAEDTAEQSETLIATSLGFLHDLNNLLGPIIAYATLARERIEAESPTRRYLDQILTAAERAREISERLLNRMRPPTSAAERIDLIQLVQEVIAWLGPEHPFHRFELVTSLASAPIEGDSVGVEQMLLNLCKNAVESHPKEGGVVSLSLSEVDGGRAVRLTVKDNGSGMDEAVLARIFEPFFSTKPAGTGLGLSVTRAVVRGHHGTISVESAPGAGTSFHVILPLAPSSH